jgi:hypothetical protein
MNSGYYPQVVNPKFRRVQTESGGFQKPFYFGGSYIPTDLSLPQTSYSGAGLKPKPKGIIVGEPLQQHKGKMSVRPYTIPYVKQK